MICSLNCLHLTLVAYFSLLFGFTYSVIILLRLSTYQVDGLLFGITKGLGLTLVAIGTVFCPS